MNTVARCLLLLLLAACSLAHAQLPLPLEAPSLDLRARGTPRTALALPDGSVIVGGDFRWIGGDSERRGLARIRADGSLDPDWRPAVAGQVAAMVADAEHLYVVGEFTTVAGAARRGLAKLRLADGTITPWDPNTGSGTIGPFRSVVLRGSSLYVGGGFTTVAGLARSRLVRIDAQSGQVDPTWAPSANALVERIVADATGLYVAGEFTQINGSPRARAAKLDLESGAVLAWAPEFSAAVTNIAVDDGLVYAAGCFQSVNGQPRAFMARVDAQTGSLDPTWAPSPNGGCTYALAVTASQVYVGGFFSQINGQASPFVGRVSKSGSGVLDVSWVPSPDAVVFGALPFTGNSVLLHGGFDRVGGYAPGLARVGASGSLLAPSLAAETRGHVRAIWPTADGGHIIGGFFVRAGAAERRSLLKITASGALDPAFSTGVQGTVYRLAGHAGQVYVAGSYNALGGTTIGALGRISESGVVDAGWRPNIFGFVQALAVDPAAGTVLVGGSIGSAGGQTRLNAAELRLGDATATAWNPGPNGLVWRILLDGDSAYLGGSFTSVGGVPRQRLAKVSRSGVGAVDLAFQADADSEVRALLLGPAGTLYAGGTFTSISGLGRPGFARLLRSTGAPDPDWSTFVTSGSVDDLAPSANGLYLGGGFQGVGNQSRIRVARVGHDGSVAPLFAPPDPDGIVLAVSESASRVLVGGLLNYFSAPTEVRRIGLFAYPLNAAPAATRLLITADSPERSQPHQAYRVSVNLSADGASVLNQRIEIADDRGELCNVTLDFAGNGACELIGRVPGVRTLTARFAGAPLLLPSIATEPHTVAEVSGTPPVNPAIDLRTASAPLATVRLSDGSLVIGGTFIRVGSEVRRGLAKLRPDGSLDPGFDPGVNGSVVALARDSADNVYVLGTFGYIAGGLRRNIAKLDANGNLVTGWSAGNSELERFAGRQQLAVEPDGNVLVQTAAVAVAGSPAYRAIRIIRLSGQTGAVLPGFSVEFRTETVAGSLLAQMLVDASHLYVYGIYDRINGVPVAAPITRIRRSDGATDGAFQLGALTFTAGTARLVNHATLDGRGGLYLTGSFASLEGRPVSGVLRVDGAGAHDPAFAPPALFGVQDVSLQPEGLFSIGLFCPVGSSCPCTLGKLDAQSGQRDPGFAESPACPARGLQRLGEDLWMPSGAQLLGPSGLQAMGALRQRASDGAPRPTPFISRAPMVRALARQPDGATLIGGLFARPGSRQANLVRVSASGQFDEGFLAAVEPAREILSLSVDASGDIFAGGEIALYKLAPSGARVPGFGSGGAVSVSGAVHTLLRLPEGLLVGGTFNALGGVARQALARVDPGTGAIDPGWNAQVGGSGQVLDMQRDPQGRIFVGGNFGSIGGLPQQHLAKLQPDGSLVTEWLPSVNTTVWSLLLDGEDLFVGGNFGSLNGSNRQQIGRLHAVTAALHPWDPNAGRLAGQVFAMARGQDGDIFVGGSFRYMGRALRSSAAKLDRNSGLADPDWNPSLDGPVLALLSGYGDTPVMGPRLAHIEQAITIGGAFEFVGPEPVPGFAAVPPVGLAAQEIFCSGFEARACE